MRLILARHMETIANRERFIVGRQDSPPTASGREQCRCLAALIAVYYPEGGIILSSPLGRAVATAEIIAAATGWPLNTLDGLAELSCGEWEGLPRRSVLPPERPLRESWTDAPGNGESCAGAETRVQEAIRHIRKATRENVLIVGHAAINQVFFKLWLSLVPEEALAVQHPHDLLYEIANGRVSWRDSTGAAGEGLRIRK